MHRIKNIHFNFFDEHYCVRNFIEVVFSYARFYIDLLLNIFTHKQVQILNTATCIILLNSWPKTYATESSSTTSYPSLSTTTSSVLSISGLLIHTSTLQTPSPCPIAHSASSSSTPKTNFSSKDDPQTKRLSHSHGPTLAAPIPT